MSVTGFNRRRRELANGRQAEQADTGRQEIKAEPSINELRKKAKEAGITGAHRMKKAEILQALEG